MKELPVRVPMSLIRRHALFIMTVTMMATALWHCGPLIEGRNPEVVMKKGMQITATTQSGRIQIIAGEGYKRIYNWDGCSKEVRLYARASRWYGSLGLYNPGAGIVWWVSCNGFSRAVVEEGQQHFKTGDEAAAWLNSLKGLEYAYNNSGLVVGWKKIPGRSELDVEVWQVLIAGQKPTSLSGARDSALAVQ